MKNDIEKESKYYRVCSIVFSINYFQMNKKIKFYML